MATKQEIIYDIREKLNLKSDDLNITNEYISYLIDKYRAVFLRNKYSKLIRKIPTVNKQRIKLTMSPTNSGNYPGALLKSSEGTPVLLYTNTLDNLVALSNGTLESFNWNMVSPEKFQYVAAEDPFIRTLVYGTILHDNKLYLKSWNSDLFLTEYVYLWGVFESPEDAWKLDPDYDATIDYNIIQEYPLEGELIADLTRTLIKDLLIKYEIPSDNLNNANDDTAKTS